MLAGHFARYFSQQMGKPFAGIQESAMQELLCYDWPGNIRELQNLLEQATTVCAGPLEWSRFLPAGPQPEPVGGAGVGLLAIPGVAAGALATAAPAAAGTGSERANMLPLLRQTQGRIRGPGGTAELLGLHPNTLDSRIKRLQIDKKAIFG